MDRITLEEVPIIFKNFSGAKGPYNQEGDRSFSIFIEDLSLADALKKDGWNVKPIKDRETEEITAAHLPVKVKYAGAKVHPRIYKVSPTNKSTLLLDETTINLLDHLAIRHADVMLNAYLWSVNNETGVKAYCHTLYAVIDETALEQKWAGFQSELAGR